MDTAFIVDAQTGAQMGPPVQFLRIPVPGELISAPPKMYTVVRVMHGWMNGPNPVAAVHVALAQGHPTGAAMAGHVSPF
jgi:hypothetical protein